MSECGRSSFSEGQIVYAHWLHLDSIDLVRHCERKHDDWGNYIYTVQGKPRPMLVIGPNGENKAGVQWYWVLKLTSAGGNPEKAKLRGLVRLGRLLDGTVSYTECRPYSYPENLFERTPKSSIGRLGLLNVLKITGIPTGLP